LPYKIENMTFKDDTELIRFCNELFSEAKQRKDELHDNWLLNEKYLRGEHWQGEYDKYRAYYRSKLTANYIWNYVDQINSSLSLQIPSFSIKPLNETKTGKADLLQSAVLALLHRQSFKNKYTLNNYNSIYCQSGFYKACYDETLYGGMGDIRIDLIDPFRVFPDTNPLDLENSQYFFDISRMPVFKVKKFFPDTSKNVIADNIPKTADGRFKFADSKFGDGLERQVSTSEAGVDPPSNTYFTDTAKNNAFEFNKGLVTVKFLYIRDGAALTKKITGVNSEGETINESSEPISTNWSVIVYTNTVILDFRPLPYWHGELPYIQQKFIDDGSFWGMDFIKQHHSGQDAINRILSDILDYIKLVVRPPIVVDTRSGLDPKHIFLKDQSILPVLGNVNDRIKFYTPPPLPAEVFGIIELIRRMMESVAGTPEVSQGRRPGSVTAASAIQALQSAASTRTALRFNTIETAFTKLIKQCIALMQQYYITSRWITIKGKEDGIERLIQFNPADIAGDWEVIVTAGSAMPTPVDIKFQRLLQMMQILASTGDNIGMAKLLVEFSGVPELSDALNKTLESQAFQNMATANKALEMTNEPSAQGFRGAESQ